MPNKHMKRCSASLSTGEAPIRATETPQHCLPGPLPPAEACLDLQLLTPWQLQMKRMKSPLWLSSCWVPSPRGGTEQEGTGKLSEAPAQAVKAFKHFYWECGVESVHSSPVLAGKQGWLHGHRAWRALLSFLPWLFVKPMNDLAQWNPSEFQCLTCRHKTAWKGMLSNNLP